MITFKQHLKEANQLLHNYTHSDNYGSFLGQIAGQYKSLSSKYPYEGGKLYRGLNFKSAYEYLQFRRSIKGNVYKSESISSWSTELLSAKQFALSPQVHNLDFMTARLYDAMRKNYERIMGFIGVILEVEVSPGIGIDVRKSGESLEDEVLLPSGQYKITNIIYEKKYSHIMKNIDINAEIIDIIAGNKKIDNDYLKALFHNKKDDLIPEVKKAIMDDISNKITNGFVITLTKVDEDNRAFFFNKEEKQDYALLFPDGSYKLDMSLDLGLAEYLNDPDVYKNISPLSKQIMIDKINKATKPIAKKFVSIRMDKSYYPFLTNQLGMSPRHLPYLSAYFANLYKKFNEILAIKINKEKMSMSDRRIERFVDTFKDHFEAI